MKMFFFLITFLILNLFTIQKPLKNEKWSILYSNPLFLRVVSPNGEHLLADKFWLLSKNIDEIGKGDQVELEQFFKVYTNITILDSTLEIAIIYASTYLASIKERGDLAIKLLQIAQLFNPDNFQYLFTELIFQIIYVKNSDRKELIYLAEKISRMPDLEKNIGRIDVTKWADDIIFFLHKNSVQTEIKEVDKLWLKSVER